MEFISNAIAWLSTNWEEALVALTSIVGGLAIIARFTPNKSDDKIIRSFHKFPEKFFVDTECFTIFIAYHFIPQ